MANLFFQATGFVSQRNLPVLSNIDEIIYTEKYEADAYAHWVFGTDNTSLTDKVNSRNLTVQAGATIQPTFTANNIVLSASVGNALITDLVDTASQNTTFCAVVKTSVTALSILIGNLVSSGATTSSGQGIFASAGQGYMTVKPAAANATGGANSVAPLPANDITQTDFFFIAGSHDKASKTVVIYTERLGVGGTRQTIYTGTYEASVNKIAIGNGYYAGVVPGTFTFAEAIIYNKVLTLSQMQAVAVRAKKRMQNRGITF